MSMVLLSAMVGCLVSTMLINSENRRPNIIVANGKMREKFYSPTSDEVKNVPLMLRCLSFFTLISYILAYVFIMK